MKKKALFSFATAAAIMFSGAAAGKTEAATNQVTIKPMVIQYTNYQDVQNLLNKYFTNKDVQAIMSQLQGQVKPCPAMVQKPVQKPVVQTPAQKPVVQTPAQKPVVQAPAQKPVVQAPAQKPQTNTVTQKPTTQNTQPTTSANALSAYEQKVVELTNVERAKQGLPALKIDTALSKVARIKSQDMKDRGYFSHTSPTYGSPFDMMKQFGISYSTAGENIAQGQRTPEEVVNAWMNSPGHRANIMNANFTHIGVGYVASGNYWTQMFIGK
jgi:uncharacterized YkwD family protein